MFKSPITIISMSVICAIESSSSIKASHLKIELVGTAPIVPLFEISISDLRLQIKDFR